MSDKKMRGRPKENHTARLNEMVEMRTKGATLKEIGERCDLTPERVRVILKDAGVSKPVKPPRYATKFSGILWAEKIEPLDIGESFIYDGRITPNMPQIIKRSAERIGRKVHVYKVHGGRIRVTRFN